MESLSRRQLLQVGGISMLGLALPQFLRASGTGPAGRSQGHLDKSCIFIFQYGGPSHIDTFDLKPDAPLEIRGAYKPMATRVPGMQICEMLPRLAQQADRYSLIRSMSHNCITHQQAQHMLFSGQSKPADGAPYFGSVLAKLAPTSRHVTSYVWLQELVGQQTAHYRRGGFLGAHYSPLLIGTNSDNAASPNFHVRAFEPPKDVTQERLEGRRLLLGALDSGAEPDAGALYAMRRYQERAFDLLTGPDAQHAFDLHREPVKVRDRYGWHPLGQNLLLARRLVEAGVRLVTVTAWTGTAPGEKAGRTETWDMHADMGFEGHSIFGSTQFGLGLALPRFDEAVSALLEDLEQRGLLEKTLIVVVGEFGRAPKINPGPGRNHWPPCYSALLCGAGIRGGAVYGASDKIAAYVKDKPVTTEDFGATVYHALGVPPETRLGADGFTQPVSEGKALLDLFG